MKMAPLLPSQKFKVLWLLLSLTVQVYGDAAILNISYVRESSSSETGITAPRNYVSYCVAFNADLSVVPSSKQPQNWSRLQLERPEMDLCEDTDPSPIIAGAFLTALRRNCSAYDQGISALRAKSSGLILVSNTMFFPGQPNTTMKRPMAFPILVLKRSDMNEIEELPFSESLQISFYAVDDGYVVDGSGICLIVIAVLVIAIGSLRSGQQRFYLLQVAHRRLCNAMEPKSEQEDEKNSEESDRSGIQFGPVAVVVFAVFMTGLLVLMYYFYNYLVYVFIALFVIGATSGCYECFKPLVEYTEITALRMPLGQGFLGKCFGSHLDIRGLLLLLCSAGLSATWVLTRNTPQGWILLDLLGSVLLISVLIGVQMPSLKSCTIFLSLLFIYDIFFVFITPFFTKDGQSVMVQVATGGYDPTRDSGGGQREVIPAAFKIPHISTGAPCENLFDEPSYSLLGFGDVMVPGFLISYLRAFELVTKIRPFYSISSCIAYLVSLVVTTAFLILMRTGQPALLYIVPILLSTVFFIAWRRREFSHLWNGNLMALYTSYYGTQLVSDSSEKPMNDYSVVVKNAIVEHV